MSDSESEESRPVEINSGDGELVECGFRLIPHADETAVNAMKKRRDIGDNAAWTLSSCKAGCGIDKLRSTDPGSFWQSEGEQPHVISIEFMKKTEIAAISFYVDFEQDESYTPHQIVIKTGNHGHDLRDLKTIVIEEGTSGFVVVPMGPTENEPIKTFVVHVSIESNHQNGRDTHLRMARVHPPYVSIQYSTAQYSPVFVNVNIN
eukprot:m.112515 g.112515  ORF g.112515 m.112515 type:complete len:205 (-) comp12787_c0_seq7:2239-2853(-)